MNRFQKTIQVLCFFSAAAAFGTPSGNRWFSNVVTYRVFNHSQIKGVNDFTNKVLPAVQSAFSTWTKPSCTTWTNSYSGYFSSPSGVSAIKGNDIKNSVVWINGSQWRYGSSTLGLTTTSFYPGTGEIFDADMELNNSITWSTSSSAPTSYDVETVVLHEAGHFLGLDHTTSSGVAVMYPTVMPGSIVRNLSTLDVNDVCSVYPNQVGAQGTPCDNSGTNCKTGLVCRSSPGGTSRLCTVDCSAGQTCPNGYTCQSADTGKACLVPAGTPDLCKFCTDGSQCSTGVCVTNGRNNWCTVACLNPQNCGSGYSCVTGGSGKVCVPEASCSSQCSSNAQCAIGYTCSNGICQATGKTGDRCEISGFCEACNLCIGNSEEAYCSSCCGGQMAGGACNSCQSTSCQVGLECQTVVANSDQVCVPEPGVSTCGSCSSSAPCTQGLTCIGGKCHAACQPSSPGNCAACYATQSGVGYCACPGEARNVGESCVVGANGGLAACVTGLRCVGMPTPTCRRPCDLAVAGSCLSSEQCKMIDGQPVCIPVLDKGSSCAECNNGQCQAGLTCLGGRCYAACNTDSPSCSDCISLSGTSGVCACEDQRAGVGQACGFFPPGQVSSCQFGLSCVNSTCRQTCDPSNDTCPGDNSCQNENGVLLCIPNVAHGDGGYVNGADAGAAKSVNQGCGCQSTTSASWGLCLLLMAYRRRFRVFEKASETLSSAMRY